MHFHYPTPPLLKAPTSGPCKGEEQDHSPLKGSDTFIIFFLTMPLVAPIITKKTAAVKNEMRKIVMKGNE